ncbi:ABC transporter permease [Paraclostridium ghonii]|uniref:ABC-2 type transport system permease protein n=1 Tax=Paraclostridium ghonii TaxID=29358 RepID=A0ABU0N309_9FIRM|nr:ABC transporter permease [Paeniclostridium ghonii]MDQ0557549.1 ABC-2 type transport system permease protein [Paeniclostridium ghonii]
MSNLLLLLKIDLLNTTGINKVIQGDKKEKVKHLLIVGAICFAIIMVAIGLYKMCIEMSNALIKINQMDLLLLIGILGISGLCLFNTIYKAPAYLYQARDYEILASLPIKDSTVLMSKMIKLMFFNYIYSFMLIIIPGLVYYTKTQVSLTFLIYIVLMYIVAPFIPIVLASVISYFLGKIASRSKYKNGILIISSIVVFLIVMYGSYNMDKIVVNVSKNSESIIEVAEKIYPLTYYFIDGLKNTNIISISIFLGVSVLVFGAFIMVFSRGFNNISSNMCENHKKDNYEVKKILKKSSPTKALLNKEIKRYLSSYIYVLNTSIGMIILIVLAIGILVMGQEKIAQIMKICAQTDIFNIQITGMIIFCILMSCTTNSSISLEGKNIWILKTSPLDEMDILKSKIYLNILLILPISIISILAIGLKLNFDFEYIITMIILIFECSILTSLYGLYINLLYPKLDYISETEVVKRSMSSMICAFSGILYIVLYAAIYYFVEIKFISVLILGIIITGMIDIVLWKLINTKGIKMFKELC